MSSTTTPVLTRTLAGLTVAAAALALSGCSLLGGLSGGSPEPTSTGDGTDTDVFTIAVGDCLNDGSVTGEVTSVKTIDCAEPHDSEAYASILFDDGDFPGDEAVNTKANDECTAAFDSFVGLAYDQSTLNFSYYYPTEESWANGDREILCLVVDPAGKTTGTLKGAAR